MSLSAQDPSALASALEAWYAREGRDLPWRRRRGDPYAVWLSEAMLQQTRVETVLGRYEDMLRRFPDVRALAASDEASVLAAWEGLGYYRRARQLYRAAREVVALHDGRLPADPALLRRLPGFGPYMTAALASIAFGQRLPATDANAVRVLSRLGRLEAPAGSRALLVAAGARHEELVLASADPGRLNQALMDLGARVCVRRPRCELCPVRAACAAFAAGGQALAAGYPRRRPRARRPERSVAMAVVVAGERVLAAERPPGLLGGLWGLPLVEAAEAIKAPPETLERLLVGTWGAPEGLASAAFEPLDGFDWAFTHRLWHVRLYRLAPHAPWPTPKGRWLAPAERAAVAFGGPFRLALAQAGAEERVGLRLSRRSASRGRPA